MGILRRLFRALPFLLLVGIIAFFTVAAGYADRRQNRVTSITLPPVDSGTRRLHSELTIVDLHADPLLWPRDLLQRSSHGHVDIPRLVEGRVAIQLFGVVTKVPPGQNYEHNRSDRDQLWLLMAASRWPPPTWINLMQRALHQAAKLDGMARQSRGRFLVIHNREDLESFLRFRAGGDTDRVAGILAMEGLQALRGNLSRLDTLFDAGFRVAGLTHFFDNEVGGSSAGENKGGITPFGRVVVQYMEERGMVVDLAHASPKLIDDVLDIAHQPVIVSHTGVQATCPGPRNLTDAAVRRVAANGGVIGIGFWSAAVCDVTPKSIVKAMRHVTDLVGAEYVALGSDFDGATTTGFDVTQLVQITAGLQQAGFTRPQIEGIMGGNALRVLRAVLPPSSTLKLNSPVVRRTAERRNQRTN